MPPIPPSAIDSGLLLAGLALVYPLLTLLATLWPRREAWRRGAARAVTVLKPLHGVEPRLRENLRSHFQQATTTPMQLLFGVRSADDPAAEIVRRLQAEFPRVDARLLVDPATHGLNGKVGNLINLLPHARHDWLLITDADVSLAADDLQRICAPLADPDVGVVTCLYRGRPLGGLWTRLGALFIDGWFAPAARLAHRLGRNDFGFGAAMALRRDALEAIGGFRALADQIADDYWLAALVRRQGLRTVLSEVVVTTDVSETHWPELWQRELRWMRTIRSLSPWGYPPLLVSIPLPLALLGLALAQDATAAVLCGGAFVARAMLHFVASERPARQGLAALPLLLPRDFLTLAAWAAGLVGRQVRWRDMTLDLSASHPTPSSEPRTES